MRSWRGSISFQIEKEIAAIGGMCCNRNAQKLCRFVFLTRFFADRFLFLAHRKRQMHARMALIGTVGPYQPAIDIVIGGWLYLVAACCDVLDFQVLEHQRSVAVI